MKRITSFSLALIMGLCLHAPSGFAQDQNPNKDDTKGAQGSPHGDKGKGHGKKSEGPSQSINGPSNVVQQVQKGSKKHGTSLGNTSDGNINSTAISTARHSTKTRTLNSGVTAQSVQVSSRGQSRQTFNVQGTRSNRYNGQWISGDTHGDWARNGDHRWNNHDYRWYDGGWLIIDAGDYQSGSIVSRVKESLAQQGYYDGEINDHVGRQRRRAIASYQADNDLPVSGHIDGPLLESLRLE